jgi:TPR repeat protein
MFVLAVLFVATAAHAEPTRTKPAAAAACQASDGPAVCRPRCDAGSQQSCAVLGIEYLRGEVGGTVDDAKAEPLLRRACDAKVALGCGGLGSLFVMRGNVSRGRPLLEQGCTLGDALACESLGGLESGASGTAIAGADLPAAMRKASVYYRRACELGSGPGCAFLAAFIADKVVQGTAKEVLELYVKACGRGVGVSCRLAATAVTSNLPEWKQLAATLDVPRLVADLRQRGCKLGDTRSCPDVK